MSLGPDIKLVYDEIGTQINVLGGASGEYIDFEISAQATKPFIREYFLSGNFQYETQAEAGSIVEFVNTADYYMVMNKTAEQFENEVIEYNCVLYKCNVSGEILRPSGEVWDAQTYHKVQQFSLVDSNCYALQTEPMYGNDMDLDEPFGASDIKKVFLYIPKSYELQRLDRWQPVSGEYYMVDTILPRRYPAVDLVILEEDNR